ncbi:hypothetical protein N566_22170 [Streptomycetaceae bacterium MP113-05]|nr:hypothetical protein N566_22170 [Streptomycetaceae bacterium MP113-05]
MRVTTSEQATTSMAPRAGSRKLRESMARRPAREKTTTMPESNTVFPLVAMATRIAARIVSGPGRACGRA